MSDTRALADLAISDNGFVFDPLGGATYSVNLTGLCILRSLKEGLGRGAIAQRLVESFGNPTPDPTSDVEEFVRLLRQHRLVPGDFAVKD
jgi:hypothetical protein